MVPITIMTIICMVPITIDPYMVIHCVSIVITINQYFERYTYV